MLDLLCVTWLHTFFSEIFDHLVGHLTEDLGSQSCHTIGEIIELNKLYNISIGLSTVGVNEAVAICVKNVHIFEV